jgi:hypothetical protein
LASPSIDENKTKETMTKTKMSEVVKGLNSRMRGLIYRQMPDGTTVVSRSPDYSGIKFTRGSGDHPQRLQGAARYARWAAQAQPIYAELAKGMKKTAYNLARSDWFHPPVIHEVSFGENKIRVQASDNVMVTKVVITVLNEHGKLLEAGEAIRREGDWWEYVSRLPGQTFTVEAWDLAGNVTRFIL